MNLQNSAPSLPRLASNSRRRRAIISLTPLIDVVFILLVFFMLASSLLDWQAINLSTPTQGTTSNSTQQETLLIEVRSDGIWLSGESVSLQMMATRIGDRLVDRPDQKVLIKPAAGVPLQDAIDVLDQLAIIGVTDMSLIRDRDL